MWFKNGIVYRFNRHMDISVEELEMKLNEFSFSPCGAQDKQSFGWGSIMGQHSDHLVHQVNDGLLLCAKREEKLLPASVIKETLNIQIEKKEEAESRPLNRAEKEALKENIIFELLPRAFSRTSQTYILILPQQDWIVVDATSHNKAEEVLALLRKTLGRLPVIPVTCQQPAEYELTNWVKRGQAAEGFTILNEAELKSNHEDGGIIRCKQQDLTVEEIQNHLKADKMVTELALDWRERLQFLFTQDFRLKRLKFSDSIKDQHEDLQEDPIARFDADLALLCGELRDFLPEIFTAFGGLVPIAGE